ncbi:MAG: trypsin-like peptidase domain-containing protein [Paracoccaceae bacterium]|nr:trypsin-like peptidase domain-containing protein [Paracoccaceae bacterium]
MTQRFLGVLTVCGAMCATYAHAQDQVWIQVEAQPTQAQAMDRARTYAGTFDNVSGYLLKSGWYAIELGPYAPGNAADTLSRLKQGGQIPPDSFVANGNEFQAQVMQAGAGGTVQTVTPSAATPIAPAATTDATTTSVADTTPAPAAAPAQPVTETLAQSQQAEAALSRAEKQQVQSALQWFGFYNSAIDGDFGPGTRASMSAWQTAKGDDATGVLTTQERAALVGTYNAAQAKIGLQTVTDTDAGISIDLPMAMIAFSRYTPPFAHYDAKDNSGVTALLISEPGDRNTLGGLYNVMQTLAIVPPQGARGLNGNSFDITGQNDTVHSFTHAEVIGGTVKGYALVWKPADDAKIAPVLAAMKQSFHAVNGNSLDATMVPISTDQRAGLLAGLELRKPIIARSGFFVDAEGDVLTTTAVLKSCGQIMLGNATEASVAAKDDKLGIALLKPAKALSPLAYAHFLGSVPPIKSQVAVAGYSYSGLLNGATMTFGTLEDNKGLAGEDSLRRLSLPALDGDAGGPVLDASGAVIGVLQPHGTDAAKVLPPDVNFAVGSAAIQSAVGQAATLSVSIDNKPLAPEDLAKLGIGMTVLVSCWK